MEFEDNKCFQLAARNYEFALFVFENGRNYDWVVISLYYSALMYSHTYFELSGLEVPRAHISKYNFNGKNLVGIIDEIGNRISDRDAKTNLRTLYDASRKYRYNAIEVLNLKKTHVMKYFIFYKEFKNIIMKEIRGI